MIQSGYEPSEEQAENSRAKAKERLLTWVWDDNRMHEKLLAAKRQGYFKTGVYARIHYDKRRGEFKIIWHPSTEVIAKYSDWDMISWKRFILLHGLMKNKRKCGSYRIT